MKVAYCAEQFENDDSLLSSIMKNIKRVMAAEFSRELGVKVHGGLCRTASFGYRAGGSPSSDSAGSWSTARRNARKASSSGANTRP